MRRIARPQKRAPFQEIKIRPTRKEILEKAWSVFLVAILLAILSFSIYIQILHHP